MSIMLLTGESAWWVPATERHFVDLLHGIVYADIKLKLDVERMVIAILAVLDASTCTLHFGLSNAVRASDRCTCRIVNRP